jgi:hypothetical protein
MTNVLITEKKTGCVVVTYPVDVEGMNYTPSANEYIARAWECAIEDKMVDAKRKADYSFALKDAPLRL